MTNTFFTEGTRLTIYLNWHVLNNPRIGMTVISHLNIKIGDQFFRGGGNVMNQPSIYPFPLALIGIEITFPICVLQSII